MRTENKRMRQAALCMGLALMAAGMTGCTTSKADGSAAETKEGGSVSTSYDDYVKLGTYKGIEIEPIEVTAEDIQSEIDYYLQQEADIIEVTDRAAELGDVVNIDYIGRIDGEAFEGGSYEGDSLELGSGDFIEGFEEGLVGVMPGETVMIPLTFPEDYWDAEKAGVDAEFEVTVNYIEQTGDMPEFTDELVVEWTGGELTTTAEYEEWLTKQMEADAQNYRRNEYMQAVMAESEFTAMPEERYNAMVTEITEYYTTMASEQYGETLEEFAEAMGMTLDELETEISTQAEESVAQLMVVLAIADAEGITVTDDECEEKALSYGYTGFSDVIDQYGEERAKEIVLMDKVIDMMME